MNIREQKALLLLALMLRLAADTVTVTRDRCRANSETDAKAQMCVIDSYINNCNESNKNMVAG